MKKKLEKKVIKDEVLFNQFTSPTQPPLEVTFPEYSEFENHISSSMRKKRISSLKDLAIENYNTDFDSKFLPNHHLSGKTNSTPQLLRRNLSNKTLNSSYLIETDPPQGQFEIQSLRFNTPSIRVNPTLILKNGGNYQIEKQSLKNKASPNHKNEYINLKMLVEEYNANKPKSELKPRLLPEARASLESGSFQYKHKRHLSECSPKRRPNMATNLPFIETINQEKKPQKFKFRNQEVILDKIFSVHRRVQTEQG